MIKAIIFDCFGVLYTDGKSQIIERCPEAGRAELNDLFLQADYGYITSQQFSDNAARLLGMSPTQLEVMNDGLYHRNQPLIEQIAAYKQQYKIGLLSNVSEDFLYELFSKDELTALFDTVVLSSQVGMIKPSGQIYHLTAERLGVLPEECVMIDDLEKNVIGAERAGMQGVVYASLGQLQSDLEEVLGA